MGVVCALLLAGCGEETPAATPPASEAPAQRPAAGDHKLTLQVAGKERTFLVHAPPGYTGDKPVPLVVGLHFYPGSGERLRDMIEMDAKADEHGFLVAYPDGVAGGFNALICCGAEDDVAFLKALTDRLIADWGVDADRVYATGISNGADMSFRAAVEATGVFAAIGAVSGGLGGPRLADPGFMPKKPVSVVTIIGGLDQYYEAFQAGLKTWRERLKCAPVKNPASGMKGVERSSARCADGSDLEVYVVADMGHSWPGAKNGQMALPDAPIVATDVLWDFFAAHPRIS
ncbi:polyhydroxybutyrate depolymerase [Actinoplanes sp. NEAU-A11]|uniref:Polyhydroxybutyrate depolymerase n=2 Tax=Actinoplanes aureus TaxID=2792083 RepID=A0A931CB71_9ACTN|nr:polyhydroxybutyrate depolymerase [Actinoplanes aureus]